ncbi:YciK family oxidoreductase [Agaribacterium haliotis]|uniref:YciK family oxidoreductase n=1 Tax=Agaribacterium haliotis TaxID=2013869 RepID=UPI000BB58FE1|nr:YciK family oxidoreductase [Agaribacterium haliotis]
MTSHTIPADYAPRAGLLTDKVILVTGATEGIGRQAALSYARAGATVILHGRSNAKLEELYDEIEEEGLPQAAIYCLSLDSAGPDDYSAMADALEQEFTQLDGLLLNAAELGQRTPVEHYKSETWAKVLQVNLTAPFMLCRALLPLLKKSEHGRIVFSTDACASDAKAYSCAYSVSKAGIDNLRQVLAHELEGIAPICVNSVDPGPTRTRLRLNAYPAEDPKSVPDCSGLVNSYLYLISQDCQQSGLLFTARKLQDN